jgi:RNA polymerase-binding transcription factor DksA
MEENTTFVRYSDEELEEFRVLIVEKIAKAKHDVQEFVDAFSNSGNDTMDTAPTFKNLEEGNAVLSKEENAQLAARLNKYIQNLEAALIRIENKTYGVCRATGELISKERLRIVPHATLSYEAKINENKK